MEQANVISNVCGSEPLTFAIDGKGTFRADPSPSSRKRAKPPAVKSKTPTPAEINERGKAKWADATRRLDKLLESGSERPDSAIMAAVERSIKGEKSVEALLVGADIAASAHMAAVARAPRRHAPNALKRLIAEGIGEGLNTKQIERRAREATLTSAELEIGGAGFDSIMVLVGGRWKSVKWTSFREIVSRERKKMRERKKIQRPRAPLTPTPETKG